MDDDDYGIFFGFGSVHDLRDPDTPTPRLYGMRSVSKAACWALHNERPPKTRRIGFKLPKSRR